MSALPELDRDDSFVLMWEARPPFGVDTLDTFSLGYSALPELNTGVRTASAGRGGLGGLRFENEMNVVSGFKKDGSQTQD